MQNQRTIVPIRVGREREFRSNFFDAALFFFFSLARWKINTMYRRERETLSVVDVGCFWRFDSLYLSGSEKSASGIGFRLRFFGVSD